MLDYINASKMVIVKWFPKSCMFKLAILLFMSMVALNKAQSGNGTTDDLQLMFKIMESDVLLFARYMEGLLTPQNKCTDKVLKACASANYEGCASALPSPKCPGGSDFASSACGNGTKCGAIYDFNVTTLRLAPGSYKLQDLEPSDVYVEDAVCYSLQAERYMINYTEQSREFWGKYLVAPPSLYYGSDNGVFRIYPGNPKSCPTNYNAFDPRLRPWYVAASTGPKDVVLVLDTSGSMDVSNRLNLMKQAAKYVINTLSVSDYVSVVTFNSNAGSLTKSLLKNVRAVERDALLQLIDQLTAGGGTNFYSGFKMAFDTIRQSVETYELSAGCQRAILFLTDGENNEGLGANDLMTFIFNETQYYTKTGRRPPVIFTYSFGSGADETLPKRIACETNGVWSRISDGGNLAGAMTAYYKYFAFGLSDSQNSNFAAWVEPYTFARGVGLGTSVSAPVYDRSVNPPILAGVVALDMSLAAMQTALGVQGEAGINEVIQRLVDRSVAYCPKFNLTECQYQSLRYEAYSNESLCSDQCSGITSLKVKLCNNNVTYPFYVLNNKNLQGKSYEERACCSVNSQAPQQGTSSGVCIDDKNDNSTDTKDPTTNSTESTTNVIAIAVGAGVGGFVFIVALVVTIHVCSKKNKENPPTPMETSPSVEAERPSRVQAEADIPVATLVHEGKIDILRFPGSN